MEDKERWKYRKVKGMKEANLNKCFTIQQSPTLRKLGPSTKWRMII